MHIGFMYQGGKVTIDQLEDFEAEFFCERGRSQIFKKTTDIGRGLYFETTTIDGVTRYDYYAKVDTNVVGPGYLKMKFTAYIRDGEQIRKEVAGCTSNVRIVDDYTY